MATSGDVRKVVGRSVEDGRASRAGVVINQSNGGSGAVIIMALALALEKRLTVRRVGCAMFLAGCS